MITLPNELQRLDYVSMNDLADYYLNKADLLRQKAITKMAAQEDQVAAGIRYLESVPRLVLRYLHESFTLNEAMQAVAKSENLPFETVEISYKGFLNNKAIQNMRARNVLIIHLAALGFSNSDIGKKVFLHPNSVSRIISQARKEYRNARAVDQNHIRMMLRGGVSITQASDIF